MIFDERPALSPELSREAKLWLAVFVVIFIAWALAGVTYVDWEWVWHYFGDPLQDFWMHGIPPVFRW